MNFIETRLNVNESDIGALRALISQLNAASLREVASGRKSPLKA